MLKARIPRPEEVFRKLKDEKPEIGQHCQVIVVDLVVESWYYQEEVNGKVEDRFLNVRNPITHWRPCA